MFKDVATEIEIQYDSVSVTKEDMINEYTASLPTTATVRLEIDGLDMNIDAKQPLETLLDRRMNKKPEIQCTASISPGTNNFGREQASQ